GKEYLESHENIIRESLEKFGFEWEPYSDYGHMRYKPYAALLTDLVADYAIEISKNLDIPIYIVKGTNMFDLKEGPVSKHAKLFGERMYEVETDKSSFVLRYAACFQQFSIAKDVILSQKNLPFGMLEIADSYRFEKPGELLLGFRLRKFTMPDLHIFCKNIEEAKNLFFYMHKKIMEEIKKINNDYELLINFGSPEFYENYKWLIKDIVIDVNKPVLVCIYPPAEERYWVVNIEYNIIDILRRVREIGTTQIDIGNGKRFGIKYIDEKNNENYVIIIHNAILGSIERYLYAVFNGALKKEKPELPLWLSPVQVRILPISEKYLEYAEEISKILEENNIRVEIDDRDLTLGRKILDAEKLWIPYIIVIGEKEYTNKTINVRKRNGEKKEIKIDDLIEEIKDKTKKYPYRPLYSTKYLSKKPNNL
ncbi:MAG: threonine--tRNA ligase, partial [Nanopusillaceae archaeon]